MKSNELKTLVAGQTYRVTEVDMDGLLGRDFHPQRSDRGRGVTAVRKIEDPTVTAEDGFEIWLCVFEDESKLVEMATFEVEEI